MPAMEQQDSVPRGILFMIAATLFLAVSNALAKWLVATYPVGEVMFIRSFSSLAACSLFVLPVTGLAVFTTQRKREHIGRGLSQSISQTFTVIALSLMPLAGATAIGFSAPLWGALLSIVWLKERAGVVRWSVLLCGFFGVLIVTNPGTDSLQIGALFALANAIMYGSVTVAVRGMTKTESANTLLMWQMATMATVHVFLLFFGMIWPSPFDALLLIGGGVANAIAQYFWTRALQLAPATAVSPFYYFLLVWALIIGYSVWGDIPTLGLISGSIVVVASGLFLLWHEARPRAPAGKSAAVNAASAGKLSAIIVAGMLLLGASPKPAAAQDERITEVLLLYATARYEEALPKLLVLGEEGDLVAQTRLGEMYLRGEGVAIDHRQALRWLTLAAQQNSPEALMDLAAMHRDGLGTRKDNRAALFWLERAADLDVSEAYGAIGELYLTGGDEQPNYAAAIVWFTRGAEKYDPDSFFALGVCHLLGLGVERNDVAAMMWFDLAQRSALDQVYVTSVKAFLSLRERLMPVDISLANTATREWIDSHGLKPVRDVFFE
jgi:drug/metabolite transporter (DMT)-like permease